MKHVASLFSFSLAAFCTSSLHAAEITVFATGVDYTDTSTYYTTDQGTDPTCWAASGSNVIAHWQDHHASVPAGTPKGYEVYNTFLDVFETPTSGQSHNLYRWWLGHNAATILGGVGFKDGYESLGGYYKDIYTKEQVDEMAWNYLDSVRTSTLNWTTDFSRAVYYALNEGHAMAINVPKLPHALTVYGASFDVENNLITSLYVADSGGVISTKGKISRVRVGVRSEDNVPVLCIPGYYHEGIPYDEIDNGRYIKNIYFLGNTKTETLDFVRSGIPIPEPSAFGLLAGTLALALVASRRRKSRSA